eukprot:364907-Chlamydomonas_euryale.AAC.1
MRHRHPALAASHPPPRNEDGRDRLHSNPFTAAADTNHDTHLCGRLAVCDCQLPAQLADGFLRGRERGLRLRQLCPKLLGTAALQAADLALQLEDTQVWVRAHNAQTGSHDAGRAGMQKGKVTQKPGGKGKGGEAERNGRDGAGERREAERNGRDGTGEKSHPAQPTKWSLAWARSHTLHIQPG